MIKKYQKVIKQANATIKDLENQKVDLGISKIRNKKS